MDALAWAARNNHAAIVMLLLAHGSKINREDDPNRNALRYAVSSGNLSMTRLLLTAGAIVPTGCPRNSELTVFCSAITAGLTGWQPVRSRHDNSTRFYRNRAPPHDKISVEEFDKRVQDRADLGRLLLEHGATIEDSFPGHLRGYEYAIHCNAAPVLEIYLDRGAVAIDQVNFQGMTPLLLAVRRNAHAVARMLVSRGADFLKPDYEGKTPLEYAQDDAMIGILYAGVGV
ncbi:ankyrin repeat-containing domain protein [Aspergillus heterothallicus]